MKPTGPIPADILICGEAPGVEEERVGEPFVGPSGQLLTAELHRAGFLRSSCFITNVCRHKPPYNPKTRNSADISLWTSDNKLPPKTGEWARLKDKWVHPHILSGYELLQKEIALVQPRLILALGNLSLWALTGNDGITKWRGSRLAQPGVPYTVVPALHPAAILRQDSQLPYLRMDFKRAWNIYQGIQEPANPSFTIEPTFEQALEELQRILALADRHSPDQPLWLAGDIETRAGMITCLGLATSPSRALCIPFLTASTSSPFYWTLDQEALLVELLRSILSHPSILHIGQNYLYDCQYFGRHWLSRPRRVFDTMIGHHSLFSTMLKGLSFLSSMYCKDHVFWKDESKDWEPGVGERQLWTYNCKDVVTTFEVAGAICQMRTDIGMEEHFNFQQSLFPPVLRMIERGIRIRKDVRKALSQELRLEEGKRRALIDWLTGENLYGPKGLSSKKVMQFFYEGMALSGVKSLKTGNDTADSDALEVIATREPLLRPLCQAINEARSIGTFIGNYIEAKLDEDGRMRCTFNIAGPITNRFSSNESAFGSGRNLQNIPTEKTGKQKVKGAKANLPNIRSMFGPDPGMTFFDADLDRADLQVVVWEAEDAQLKEALRSGIDMHCMNACDIFDIKGIPYDELVESHPNYPSHRAKIGALFRNRAKQGVHAVDYGIGARKLAITLGITILEAERFISRWLAAHPGIRKWQKRTEEEARKKGYIENKFGARLYQFGHFDLPEALGWLPQSTVAGVINRILVAIDAEEQAGRSLIQLLIQVHDSLAGQFPTESREEALATLQACSQIVIPYDDPLIIPMGVKTSEVSWGDCV